MTTEENLRNLRGEKCEECGRELRDRSLCSVCARPPEIENPNFKGWIGWRSMESAPKDGSRVLVLSGEVGVHIGHWLKSECLWMTDVGWLLSPRFWMPLPEVPKE